MTRFPGFLPALVLIASVASAQAPPPPSPPGFPQVPPRDATAKTGTARIRGRVVAADTSRPLRKVQMRLTSAELRENRLATTDDTGVYELKELSTGRYQLTASKGSFVQLQYGQTRPFETGKPLQLAEGQAIDKVDFSLPRGAVITGRIVDEAGEPTNDVQVSVMRYGYVQGRRQLVSTGRSAASNDIGEYRVYGLPPGQYYVTATLRTFNLFDTATGGDTTGYAPTYYPGTTHVDEAQRLTIELGQTRSGIDIALTPVRLARITGRAIDSEGRPITAGSLVVGQTSGGGGFSFATGGGTSFKPDGSFTVSNIAPGEYTIAVSTSTSAITGPIGEGVSTTVTVNGEDINGLQLVGVKPSTITGRVIVSQAVAGSLRPSAIQLFTTPTQPSPIPTLVGGGSNRLNDDFTFEIKVPAGQRLIRLNAQTPGISLKAVRINGNDVIDSGFEFRPNQDVSGVEIELTNIQSELSGVVTNVKNEAVKDYSVIVFARDSARWSIASRYLGNGRPDQDGRFKVRGLPAGEYYAIALDYLEPGANTDPEFLERIRSKATEFSLTEGQAKTLDLQLVTGL